MPRVKVTYELTAAEGFITIESVTFDNSAVVSLPTDRVTPQPPSYKSHPTQEYLVFPDNQYANIKVVASGTTGFGWSMKVTFTILNSLGQPIGTPYSPTTPIDAIADGDRNASFNKSVLWKQQS